MVANVFSVRSSNLRVLSQPKSCAARLASKLMPMLVGDVRWATTATGYCWRLSGGSQLSEAVTNCSKKAHVFLPSLLRNFFSVELSDTLSTSLCKLMNHEMNGEVNQTNKNGADHISACGYSRATTTMTSMETAGAIHILPRHFQSVSAHQAWAEAGDHSSKCFLVIYILQSVTAIAFMPTYAS